MARRKNPAELLLLNPAAAPPSVKKNLDTMLDRTGKTEDILTSLADIYAERAQTSEYADSVEQMHQTEDALRSAAQAVEDVWTEDPNYYSRQGASPMLRHNGFFDFFRSKPQAAPAPVEAAPAPVEAAPSRYKRSARGYPLPNVEVLFQGDKTIDLNGEPVVVRHEHIVLDEPEPHGRAQKYQTEHLTTFVPYRGKLFYASTKRSTHVPTGNGVYDSASFGTYANGEPDFSLAVSEHKRLLADIVAEHDKLVQEIPSHVDEYLLLREEYDAEWRRGLEREQEEMRENGEHTMLRHNPRQPAKVQSVIIPKDRFTKRQARAWIAQHGFIDPGVNETEHHYRFRQMDPDRQHFKYRTIPFGRSGVQAVVRVSRLPQVRSNPDNQWVIVSKRERDSETGEPLYWSNEDGWVDLDSATVFSSDEKRRYSHILDGEPTVSGSVWTAKPQMRSNPDAALAAIRAAATEEEAVMIAFPQARQLARELGITAPGGALEKARMVAQAVRSGAVAGAGASVAAKVAAMPEVAQALEGTGLVPVALAQATQIAEVQTSQGVVDVPVTEAASPEKSVKDRREEERAEFEQMIEEAQSWGEVLGIAQGVPLAFLRSIYGYGVTPESLATECFPEGDEDEDEDEDEDDNETLDHLRQALRAVDREMDEFGYHLREADERIYDDWNSGDKMVRPDGPLIGRYTATEAKDKAVAKLQQKLDALPPPSESAVDEDDEDYEEDERDEITEAIEGLEESHDKLMSAFEDFSHFLREIDEKLYRKWWEDGAFVIRDRGFCKFSADDIVDEFAARRRRSNPEWAKSLGRLAQRGASAAAKGARRAASYAAEVGRDFSHGVRSAHQEAAQSGSAGMPSGLVDKVEDLASQNFYAEALALVAKALGDKDAAKQAKKIDAQHEKIGHLTPELEAQRDALAQAVFANAQAVWGAAAGRALHDAYVGAM